MRQTGIFTFAGSRLLMMVLIGILLVACASFKDSPDYERHRYSQLSEPFDRSDVLYFDATFDPNFPDGDSAAEAKRMEWLTGWLEQRSMCPNGYEILKRRPFEMLEHNPARYDIRYEVKCKISSGT